MNKIKFLSLLLIVATLLTVLVACGGDNASSPEECVEYVVNSVFNNEPSALSRTLCSQKFWGSNIYNEMEAEFSEALAEIQSTKLENNITVTYHFNSCQTYKKGDSYFNQIVNDSDFLDDDMESWAEKIDELATVNFTIESAVGDITDSENFSMAVVKIEGEWYAHPNSIAAFINKFM